MIATLLTAVLSLQSEELAEAAKKSAALENYSFKTEIKSGNKKKDAAPIEGRFVKDQALALKAGFAEGFKKGATIIVKDGEDYKPLEKPAKGQKNASASAEFATVKIPHEELEAFEKSFEKVEKAAEKDGDKTVWSGALTPAAARSFVSLGGKADGKDKSTYTGTAKVWVDGNGVIVKYEITATIKGENKKGPFEQQVTKTVILSEIGTTKVELPEAAKKALGAQS